MHTESISLFCVPLLKKRMCWRWAPTMAFLALVVLFFQMVFSHPDEGLSIKQLVQKHGYPIETHRFETPDGYLLKAFRIPHGKSGVPSKRVALIVHGAGGTAENFIILGPPNAMAFYMADRGYDVWLLNARGSKHSRKHRTFSPDSNAKQFWSFSFHEIGIYDLPTAIEYVLSYTKAKKLFYVGHSQGGTSFYIMLSERPEFNDKISAAALLAPSSHLEHVLSPVYFVLARMLRPIKGVLDWLRWYELFTPNSRIVNDFLMDICRPESMHDLCLDVIYFVGGTENQAINKTLLPLIVQWMPSGLAAAQFYHYGQLIVNGGFTQYNHGPENNLRIYNSTTPPEYNMSNVRVPVAYFYADHDPFSNIKVAQAVFKKLPNVILKHRVPIDNWNHLDYILAYNAHEVIYDKICDVFQQF